LDSPFSYSGRSVARQQLLATSLRLDNRVPLGAGNSCAPGPFLTKSGFGGLNNRNYLKVFKRGFASNFLKNIPDTR
jgi:hypothetical protein